MATLLELAQMSSASYEPAVISSSLDLNIDYWIIIDQSSVAEDNYYGIAYRNVRTGEIVIANRGTDLTHGAVGAGKDLWSDAQLFAQQDFAAQRDAIRFALKVASDPQNKGVTITETGHSLGGNEAAAAYAALCVNGYAHVSAVTFQAPQPRKEPRKGVRVINSARIPTSNSWSASHANDQHVLRNSGGDVCSGYGQTSSSAYPYSL